MAAFKFRDHFTIGNSPGIVIIFLLLVYTATNFRHHNWTRDDGPIRGVIKWDIISYYGYLPATFIHGDPRLDFLEFWWSPTAEGKKIIIVSCGLSILYAPFFFMAHLLAPVFGETNDGFSSIYQFFLVFGALVYLAIGLIFLKKILLRFFTPRVTAITLLIIGLGTNLYYYSTHEAVMSHSYNFVLIILFLYMVLRWYDEATWLRTFLLGMLFGGIVLIRPTNILILILLVFWGVDSWSGLAERIRFFLRNIPKLGLMIFAFLLPWIPQFIYWHMITGQILYYSYGAQGDRFYFDNPHILESLFSYQKGWLLYTPVMVFAFIGLVPLKRKIKGSMLPVMLFLILIIYVLSSWWAWWFGGSFGLRAYVDIYGVLALPLAAAVEVILSIKKKQIRYGVLGMILFLVIFQLNQHRQYVRSFIHWDFMSKKTYWLNFMRVRPSHDFLHLLSIQDEELCRKGIYVYYDLSEDWSYLDELSEIAGIELVTREIQQSRTLPGDIKRYARRKDIGIPEATRMTAERIYHMKKDHQFYGNSSKR
jgi:hypothetical protein